MTGRHWRILLLAAAVVGLTGQTCATTGVEWPPEWFPGGDKKPPPPPDEVGKQAGKGKVKVRGASLYSPGQKVFKELRQQETLNAFLVCQGEPDFVEVSSNADAPKIRLTYSRKTAHERGTVDIVPSSAGYYVAQPIKPIKTDGIRPPPPPIPPPPPPEKDPDHDGLDDRAEKAAGTDPRVADTDADGLSDGDEVKIHETDPLVPDSDGDGLSDGDEVRASETDPLNADSDGDGLPDGDEVKIHGTDPTAPDSDGDGLFDGFEVASAFDPLVSGEETQDPDNDGVDNLREEEAGTDPHDADTDDDGNDDHCELSVGTDPNDASSTPPPELQPTDSQRDDCPIEPWRRDCQDLCTECAQWEWCGAEP